jgi:hypothetical protein
MRYMGGTVCVCARLAEARVRSGTRSRFGWRGSRDERVDGRTQAFQATSLSIVCRLCGRLAAGRVVAIARDPREIAAQQPRFCQQSL